VPVRIVVAPDGRAASDPAPPDEEPLDLTELTDAPPDSRSPVDHLTSAFPGAELLPPDEP
jgi:hypothetical protein